MITRLRLIVLLLLAHLSMTAAAWPAARYDAVIAALFVVTVGPAWTMARNGPVTRRTVPASFLTPATAPGQPAGSEPVGSGSPA